MKLIYVAESEIKHLHGPLVFFNDKMSEHEQKRFTEAHRALRSLPPELMFINYKSDYPEGGRIA